MPCLEVHGSAGPGYCGKVADNVFMAMLYALSPLPMLATKPIMCVYYVAFHAHTGGQQCRAIVLTVPKVHYSSSRVIEVLVQGGGTRGLTMSDIVNDDSKLARVRIDGVVNGRSFTVERSTRRQGSIPPNILLRFEGSARCATTCTDPAQPLSCLEALLQVGVSVRVEQQVQGSSPGDYRMRVVYFVSRAMSLCTSLQEHAQILHNLFLAWRLYCRLEYLCG